MIFHDITTAVSEKLVWNSISGITTQAKKGRLSKEKFKEYMGALSFKWVLLKEFLHKKGERKVLQNCIYLCTVCIYHYLEMIVTFSFWLFVCRSGIWLINNSNCQDFRFWMNPSNPM